MLFHLILINNQIINIYILFAIIIISMEKKVFHSKKGKKDFKSKRLNKEEKTLFPYTFLGISLESTPQISDAVSIVDLSEAFFFSFLLGYPFIFKPKRRREQSEFNLENPTHVSSHNFISQQALR